MLDAIAFMLVDSPLDAPPALFGGGTTRAEAAKRRQRKQERRRPRKERRRNSSPAKPSAAQALEVLGLKAGATEQEIRAAYTRLMKRVHPDFGESNFFATQLNEVTQLSCGRGADRATLLEVVEGSLNIDGQYDRDTGAMLFQLHRYIETWVGPRCPEYEGGCAVCYMWAIYDKLAKYTQYQACRQRPSRLVGRATEDRLNISPWPGEIYGCLEFGSSTCSKRSLFIIAIRSSPTNSPMLMFRNCASNASCLIMSCVSGNSRVRSSPLYFILRAKFVPISSVLARSSCGVVAWGCSTGPDCEFC